jgi:hypothetical protein
MLLVNGALFIFTFCGVEAAMLNSNFPCPLAQ